jgi:hypothetical protein
VNDPSDFASKRHIEGDISRHAELIRGHPPLKEIGDFLHVLEIHKLARTCPLLHAKVVHEEICEES